MARPRSTIGAITDSDELVRLCEQLKALGVARISIKGSSQELDVAFVVNPQAMAQQEFSPEELRNRAQEAMYGSA